MAAFRRTNGLTIATSLLQSLTRSSNCRSLCGIVSGEVLTSHTEKWMQDTSKKSPMELINEVPPIKVEGRIVACEGVWGTQLSSYALTRRTLLSASIVVCAMCKTIITRWWMSRCVG
ncbi:NADH dehydrogenase [ubiquinone] iron-sulfur protein 6, mitochondrial [Sesamum alatum]|uniref:NADH dehydrogenase [ubiquinone] iron-sulfur protein 6, mitochondrial n=1 Tax=Sesamum alatum TaxID=300844 RepID=A0AAE2CSS5_9LAMI|nr:NADH dehydrogenase [ubiquinone] iron-sulfur protein 6, mitochondrial [Sesamum alatum]